MKGDCTGLMNGCVCICRYNEDIELEDAIHTAILTLKEGFEGQMNERNIEIGVVNKSGEFRVLSTSEVKDYLGEVE